MIESIKKAIKQLKLRLTNCVQFFNLTKNKTLEERISREKYHGGPVPHIFFTRNHTNDTECWSYIGRVEIADKVPGQQILNAGDGCEHAMLHEITHAVGFRHEQTRP